MKIPNLIRYILYAGLGLLTFVLLVTVGNTIRISSSEEYTLAKEYLTKNPELIQEVGEIKNFGRFPSGGIRTTNGAKFAQIEVDVEGSKAEAKVILLMSQQPLENWSFDEIHIQQE